MYIRSSILIIALALQFSVAIIQAHNGQQFSSCSKYRYNNPIVYFTDCDKCKRKCQQSQRCEPAKEANDWCGYEFPVSAPTARAYIIIPLSKSLSAFTLNYFVQFFRTKDGFPKSDAFPLSTFFNYDNQSTFSDILAYFPSTNHTVPFEEWIQVTQIWRALDGISILFINGQPMFKRKTNWIRPLMAIDGFFMMGQKARIFGSDGKPFFWNGENRFSGIVARLQMWDEDLNGVALHEVLSGVTQYSSIVPKSNLISRNCHVLGGANCFKTNDKRCIVQTSQRLPCDILS